MKITTALRSVLMPLLGSLVLVSVVGCGGIVSKGGSGGGDGGSGGDGGGNEGGSGGDGGGVTSPPGTGGVGGDTGCSPAECGIADGVAMTYAQLQSAGSGSGSSGSESGTTGPGGGPSPDTQFLIYGMGADAPSCSAPYGNGGCGGWHVSISLAAELLQPGVIAFGSGADFSFFESFDEGNGTCSGGGGGGFAQGQLEILSVDANSVHFIVSGIETFDFDGNGEHIAARCP